MIGFKKKKVSLANAGNSFQETVSPVEKNGKTFNSTAKSHKKAVNNGAGKVNVYESTTHQQQQFQSPVSKSKSTVAENKSKTRQSLPPALGSSSGQGNLNKEAALNSMMPVLNELMTTAASPQNIMQQQRQLRRILHCLEDWDQIDDETLLKLISQVKDTELDMLDERFGPLVQQIMSGNWHTRSSKVVKAMEDFITEILVAKSSFGGIAIQTLIMKFNPSSTAIFKQADEIPLNEEKKFKIAHKNLKKVFRAFPMKKESAVKTMGSFYPYMTKGPHVHYSFVKNLLVTVDYIPDCEVSIIHLIIHKLTRIDVNIPREDLESALNQYNDNNFDVKNERGGRDLYNSMDLDIDGFENSKVEYPLIETVDICLNLVFDHLTSKTFVTKKPTTSSDTANTADGDEEDTNDNNESILLSKFNALLIVFETEILPTFGVYNVQFVFFYLISLRPKFATVMLDFLWKKVISLNTSNVMRVQSMAYISGILARSTVISIKTMKRWLTRMAEWANEYSENKVGDCHWSSVNIQAHGVFYAVCQGLFYVFAFRNKELIGSRKCIAFTRTLNLGRLVTSQLNPLKACSNDVAECFVNSAHQHQISYCRTVLERNQAATIPLVSGESMSDFIQDSDNLSPRQLESFFPFDPFCLRRCKTWTDATYRMYEPYLEKLKIEKTDSSSRSHNTNGFNNEDEDSIEMELGSYSEKSNGFKSLYCNGIIPFKFKSELNVKDELLDDEFTDC